MDKAPAPTPPMPSDMAIGSLAYWYNETARIAHELETTDPEWSQILLELGTLVNDVIVSQGARS